MVLRNTFYKIYYEQKTQNYYTTIKIIYELCYVPLCAF